jgi:hypothetical protein
MRMLSVGYLPEDCSSLVGFGAQKRTSNFVYFYLITVTYFKIEIKKRSFWNGGRQPLFTRQF